MLEYQHRMHNDISRFCAKEIYNGEALHNGTIINRNWDYSRYSRRAIWLNVNSDRNCSNENAKEVDVIVEEIKAFVEYASKNPKKNGEKWSIACLTYYRKQEKLLKEKIKNIFNDKRAKNYYVDENKGIELMIYTVDKFQGKEADVVFLSMIKCGAVPLGFMDSPNRLNVALTRAKYQMVIVGNKEYFNGNACKSRLLRKVAEEY
jgi:superfamily I DNA and/or RNA helicase